MKGQFMMISSVIIGVIVLSVAQTVSERTLKNPENRDISYTAEMIKQEAKKIDVSSEKERKSFREMVQMIDSYRTEITFWGDKNCFNVTLETTKGRGELSCIG